MNLLVPIPLFVLTAVLIGILLLLCKGSKKRKSVLLAEKVTLRAQQAEALAREFIDAHYATVEKFLAVAEIKVSTLDEYGDENWAALSKEIRRCAKS